MSEALRTALSGPRKHGIDSLKTLGHVVGRRERNKTSDTFCDRFTNTHVTPIVQPYGDFMIERFRGNVEDKAFLAEVTIIAAEADGLSGIGVFKEEERFPDWAGIVVNIPGLLDTDCACTVSSKVAIHIAGVCPYVTVAELTSHIDDDIASSLLNGEVYVPKNNFIGELAVGRSPTITVTYVAGRTLPKVIQDLKKATVMATPREKQEGMTIRKMARLAGYPSAVVEWDVSLTGQFRHGENPCGILAQDPGGDGPRVKGPLSLDFATQASDLSSNSFRTAAGVVGLYTPPAPQQRVGHIKWTTPAEAANDVDPPTPHS